MKYIDKEIQTVYFGGGCFWCLEGAFGTIKEIISILPGYMGGTYANPTYDSVCSGETGHAEIIKIDFSSKSLFLEDLLKVFFKIWLCASKSLNFFFKSLACLDPKV